MANLLAWRERNVISRIKYDLLIFCITTGIMALLLESCLTIASTASYYYSRQNHKLENIINNNKKNHQHALENYQQLQTAQSQQQSQLKLQQQWLSRWQNTLLLAQLSPHDLQWKTLEMTNNSWIIAGTANASENIQNYQASLKTHHFESELNDWEQTPKQNNFVLKIYPQTP